MKKSVNVMKYENSDDNSGLSLVYEKYHEIDFENHDSMILELSQIAENQFNIYTKDFIHGHDKEISGNDTIVSYYDSELEIEYEFHIENYGQ